MKHWISLHREALRLVFSRMLSTKLATLMMLSVIGLTLSLPAGLYLVLDNASRLAGGIESDPQISLFLNIDASKETVKALDKQLSNHKMVRDHRFVGRDDAWAELKQKAGLDDLAGGLEKNPLPDAFIVHTRSNEPAAVEQLRQEIAKWDGIDHVQLDAAWVKRLYSLLQVGRQAVLVLAGLLGFALLAVVGNTIRLQILTQREEIEVSQLIGATNAFIRRPFLYAGSLHGLGGGIAAWILLLAATTLFNFSVEDVARLYASDFRLTMLDGESAVLLLGGSTLLGWLGSYLAVTRYLSSLH